MPASGNYLQAQVPGRSLVQHGDDVDCFAVSICSPNHQSRDATDTLYSFLPNTVNFKDEVPPTPMGPRSPPSQLNKRAHSSIDLPSRQSTLSLLGGQTPPMTPALQRAEHEAFFTPGIDEQKRHLLRPGDPRSLLRSDTHAEWGAPGVFNQPKSRAGPLPSSSIQDFAKAYENIKQQEEKANRKQSRRVTRPSPAQSKSRGGSSDHGYEDKTWTVEPAIHGNGGLVNAIREVTDETDDDRSDTTWIGMLYLFLDDLNSFTNSMKRHFGLPNRCSARTDQRRHQR